METADRIHIRDLEVDCIIGVAPIERQVLQRVRLNIELGCDLSPSGLSDDIADTLNYKALRDEIAAEVAHSGSHLIEHLAHRVARVCLKHAEVRYVRVCLDKPGALTGSRSVAVDITRTSEN